MREILKENIRKGFHSLGYDIRKRYKSDLHLYQNFPQISLKERRFYNVGAGEFSHPYWTNIDYGTDYYQTLQKTPFIQYDLMALKPFPIEGDTAEMVYTSHTIEHVSNDAVFNMIKESYRILKKGGCIRLTTPDADLEYAAYKKNDLSFWYWVDYYIKPGTWEPHYKIPLSKASIHQLFLHHFASQLCEIDIDDTATKKYSDQEIIAIMAKYPMEEALDFFINQCRFNPNRPGNHINWWTYDKLASFLKKAGFTQIYKSGHGQSLFPQLRNTDLFDNTHEKMSVFVEAVK